jgi:choline dehydrogenase-like flavoprotein
VSAAGREPVVVVGSGAGGAVSAWAYARAGHPVLILEKGRNLLPGLGGDGPVRTTFSNDEVKKARFYEDQDPLLEPRTQRTQAQARRGVARSFVGDVNDLPTTVGGGTVHWDAKVPRFWRQDFHGRSLHGPVAGANVADWPLSYDDLAPYYDEVERHLGVQGDRGRMPARTLAQAPRRHAFAMGPNPPMIAGTLLADAASALGYHAYPFPMAVNSRTHLGRPACNSCGFCSGFGCPIHARGGAAVSFLHQALQHGAVLRSRCFVDRVETTRDGRRARGVAYRDAEGRRHRARAGIVVLAPSAIETARLLLLSRNAAHPHGLGNRSGQVGRNLMFHYFTAGIGFFADRVHAWRGPSTTFTLDDFVGPVTGADARRHGLPYLKGGVCEVGGGTLLLDEARLLAAAGFRGAALTSALRDLALRDHIAGIQLVGEDLPQRANRVDLDPEVRDLHGLPVPRITHTPHAFERAASAYFAPKLHAICARAAPGPLTDTLNDQLAALGPASGYFGPYATAHVMGTARMGHDPRDSVVDAFGRVHDVEGLRIADASVFVSSGPANPTLTLMALALRSARHAGR